MCCQPPGCEFPLLADIDLSLPPHSIGLVYGRSGAGKTTLLQVLAGLREETSGAVRFEYSDGRTVRGAASTRQQNCGLVFQFPERHFLGTNLMTELLIGTPAASDKATAEERMAFTQRLPVALAAVRLDQIPLGSSPNLLSDGYKRRLALAVQLLRSPTVLLLDEPLAGLDWRARNDLVALLRRLTKNCSLLVVSHDLRELAPVVDVAWEMLPGGCLEYKGEGIPSEALAASPE